MKKEITGIACTVIIILISMWFLLKQLTMLRRVEAELGVEFVNPMISFMWMAALIAFMINSLIKDLRQLGNQGKTQEATKNN